MEHIQGTEKFFKNYKQKRNALFEKIKEYQQEDVFNQTLKVSEAKNDIGKNEFKKSFYTPIKPAVFRGIAKDWEAVKKWDFDFFINNYGEEEVILTNNVGLSSQEFEKILFKDYLTQIRQGAKKYLAFSSFIDDHQELQKAYDNSWFEKIFPSVLWKGDPKFFIGTKGSITPIHVGANGFFFLQIHGSKKWTLYPPEDRIFLDARASQSFHFYSDMDPYKDNNKDFPIQSLARKYEVVINAGDVLWVPVFFWHQVENLSESIGLRYGQTNPISAFHSSKILTLLILFSKEPNIFQHIYTSLLTGKEHQLINKQ